MIKSKIRKYHAAVWDEPLVMQLSQSGRRGAYPPVTESGIKSLIGDVEDLIPKSIAANQTNRFTRDVGV